MEEKDIVLGLKDFYQHYVGSTPPDEELQKLAGKFSGREDALWADLYKHYDKQNSPTAEQLQTLKGRFKNPYGQTAQPEETVKKKDGTKVGSSEVPSTDQKIDQETQKLDEAPVPPIGDISVPELLKKPEDQAPDSVPAPKAEKKTAGEQILEQEPLAYEWKNNYPEASFQMAEGHSTLKSKDRLPSIDEILTDIPPRIPKEMVQQVNEEASKRTGARVTADMYREDGTRVAKPLTSKEYDKVIPEGIKMNADRIKYSNAVNDIMEGGFTQDQREGVDSELRSYLSNLPPKLFQETYDKIKQGGWTETDANRLAQQALDSKTGRIRRDAEILNARMSKEGVNKWEEITKAKNAIDGTTRQRDIAMQAMKGQTDQLVKTGELVMRDGEYVPTTPEAAGKLETINKAFQQADAGLQQATQQLSDLTASDDIDQIMDANKEFNQVRQTAQDYVQRFPELAAQIKANAEAQEGLDASQADNFFTARWRNVKDMQRTVANTAIDGLFGAVELAKSASDTFQAAFGEDLSNYSFSDKVLDGIGNGIDKYARLHTLDKGIFDEEGSLNPEKLPGAVAGSLADMYLLVAGGRGLGTAIGKMTPGYKSALALSGGKQTVGVMDMISSYEKGGMVLSSMMLNHKDQMAKAKSAGLADNEALTYANYTSLFTSLLEMVSPNDALLRGNQITNKGLDAWINASKDGKAAAFLRAFAKEIPAENMQEIMQMLAEKGSEVLYDAATGKDNFQTNITANEVKETVLLTTLTTGIATGFSTAGYAFDEKGRKAGALEALSNSAELNDYLAAQVNAGNMTNVDAAKVQANVEAYKMIKGGLSPEKRALLSGGSEDQDAAQEVTDKEQAPETKIQKQVDADFRAVLQEVEDRFVPLNKEIDQAVSSLVKQGMPVTEESIMQELNASREKRGEVSLPDYVSIEDAQTQAERDKAAAQQAQVTEQVPVTEEVTTEQAPITEQVPVTEEVTTEQAPVTEQVPVTEEVITEQAPVTEQVPVTEEVATEQVPVTETGGYVQVETGATDNLLDDNTMSIVNEMIQGKEETREVGDGDNKVQIEVIDLIDPETNNPYYSVWVKDKNGNSNNVVLQVQPSVTPKTEAVNTPTTERAPVTEQPPVTEKTPEGKKQKQEFVQPEDSGTKLDDNVIRISNEMIAAGKTEYSWFRGKNKKVQSVTLTKNSDGSYQVEFRDGAAATPSVSRIEPTVKEQAPVTEEAKPAAKKEVPFKESKAKVSPLKEENRTQNKEKIRQATKERRMRPLLLNLALKAKDATTVGELMDIYEQTLRNLNLDVHPESVIDLIETTIEETNKYLQGASKVKLSRFDARTIKNLKETLKAADGTTRAQLSSMPITSGTLTPSQQRARELASKDYRTVLVDRLKKAFPNISVVDNASDFAAAVRAAYGPRANPADYNGLYHEGKIYLNPDTIRTDTPIHEFAHLWVQIAKRRFSTLLSKGYNLVEGTKYYTDAEAAYGKYDAAGNLLNKQEVLEEALVDAIAEQGVSFFDKLQSNRFRRWYNDLMAKVGKILGIRNKLEKVSDMTLQDLTQAIAKDMLNGVPVSTITEQQVDDIANGKYISEKAFRINSGLLRTNFVDRNVLQRKIEAASAYTRRLFSPTMDLPGKVHQLLMDKKAEINAHVKRTDQLAADYQKLLKEHAAYLKKQNPATAQAILEQDILAMNDYLNGKNAPMPVIPSEFEPVLTEMRNHIDALSVALMDSIADPESDLYATIDANLGIYLTRQYEVFDAESIDAYLERVKSQPEWENAVRFFVNQANTPEVSSMEVMEATNGTLTVTLKNKYGVDVVLENMTEFDIRATLGTDAFNKIEAKIRTARSAPGTTESHSFREYPTATNVDFTVDVARAPAYTERYLRNFTNDVSGATSEVHGKSFGKDLSILKKKNTDIPEEILRLLGEYRDPEFNYINTVMKMSSLLATQEMLTQMRSDGLGSYLFEPGRIGDKGKGPIDMFTAEIAAPGSSTLAPLNGLLTTPEIKKAIEMATEVHQASMWDYITLWNGLAKRNKTIFSPTTQVRNILGNKGFMWNQGHLFQMRRKKLQSSEAAFASAAAEAWDLTINGWKNKLPAERQDKYLELTALGVINDGFQTGMINDAMDRAKRITDKINSIPGTVTVQKNWKKFADASAEIYQLPDDYHKIIAFELELQTLMEAYPDKTVEVGTDKKGKPILEPSYEIKKMAALNVLATMPTYSRVPQVIKKLNRVPFFGTFVAFTSEQIRVQYNTIALAGKEISSGNPRLRERGIARMAGALSATFVLPTVAAIARAALGISGEEESWYRRFRAPWSKNATVIPIGKTAEGRVMEIDVSYTDPFSYFSKAMIAFHNGEDMEQAALAAMGEIVSPFLGTEIFMGSLLDVMLDQKDVSQQFLRGQDYPRKIYEPTDLFRSKMYKSMIYMAEKTAPGFVTQADRIRRAGMGIPKGSRYYDLNTEILAMVTGQRVTIEDIPTAVKYKCYSFSTKMDGIKSSVKKGLITQERGDLLSKHIFEEFYKDINAANKIGIPIHELIGTKGMVKEYGVESYLVTLLRQGIFMGIDEDGKWKKAGPNLLVSPGSPTSTRSSRR